MAKKKKGGKKKNGGGGAPATPAKTAATNNLVTPAPATTITNGPVSTAMATSKDVSKESQPHAVAAASKTEEGRAPAEAAEAAPISSNAATSQNEKATIDANASIGKKLPPESPPLVAENFIVADDCLDDIQASCCDFVQDGFKLLGSTSSSGGATKKSITTPNNAAAPDPNCTTNSCGDNDKATNEAMSIEETQSETNIPKESASGNEKNNEKAKNVQVSSSSPVSAPLLVSTANTPVPSPPTNTTNSNPNNGDTKKGRCCGSGTTTTNNATSISTPSSVCCGCGDNCRCCIENGWAYCQCGPNCTCLNPLMAEQASLVMEATAAMASENNSNPAEGMLGGVDPALDLESQQTNNKTSSLLFVDIVVGGMTCTMCSSAITNALAAMDVVRSVTVSLSTDVAHIEFHPSDDEGASASHSYAQLVEDVQETISDVGFLVVDVMKMPNMDNATPPPPKTAENTNNTANGGAGDAQSTGSNNNNDNGSIIDYNNTNSQQDRWNRIAQRQEEKLEKRKKAFLWSLVGTLPILLLTMIVPHVIPQSSSIMQWWHRQKVHLFHDKTVPLESLVLWLLATPVQFICGSEFYKSSYYGVFRTGTLGMDVLVVLGTTASYGYALYATFNSEASMMESHFFETSAVLICFVLLGKWMQALAVHRTSDALSHLMQLTPSTAIRVTKISSSSNTGDGSQHFDPMKEAYSEEVIPTNLLQRGDVVKIVPGASLPADGVVLAGELAVDESMVTGESMPVLKTKDSLVLGGTVCVESSTDTNTYTATNNAEGSQPGKNQLNGTENITSAGQVAFCKVTGVGSSTALAQIIQLVQDAQASKVPMQNFADTVSSIFVPAVATLSIISFLVWYALCSSGVVPEEWYTDLDEDAATFSLMFGIACLVISCPCALGLATPTAVMVGTGVGAKLGILLKGGEAFEAASKVDAVVLDKTGTVTTGKPVVTDFQRLSPSGNCYGANSKKKDAPQTSDEKPISKDTMLWLLGSLERSSEHPLAKAIVAFAEHELSRKRKGVSYLEEKPFMQPSEFRSMTGRGASGYLQTNNRHFVAVGNRAFFATLNVELTTDIDDQMKTLEEQGKTAILAAINYEFCAILGVADELKPDAAASVAYLRNVMKIDVWMVTGDNARTAQAIAR